MRDPPDLFAIECRFDNGAAEIFLIEARDLDRLQYGWMFASAAGRVRDVTIRVARTADRARAASRPGRALRSVA